MALIKCVQHSAEWFEARLGCCTASRVKDAINFLKKGGESAARRNYRFELLAERLTGLVVSHYVSPAMDWGIANEKYARAAYEVVSGNDVDGVGIYQHDEIPGFLASPDGLIGTDGLLEIKCPLTTTHLSWQDEDVVPEEHIPQMLAQMACSGRKYVDFCSFDPRLHPRDQVFIKRLEWNQEYVDLMEEGVRRFLSELEAMVARRGGPREPIEAPEPQEDPLGITDDDIDWIKQQQASR